MEKLESRPKRVYFFDAAVYARALNRCGTQCGFFRCGIFRHFAFKFVFFQLKGLHMLFGIKTSTDNFSFFYWLQGYNLSSFLLIQKIFATF